MNYLFLLEIVLLFSVAYCKINSLSDGSLKYHVSVDAENWYQALINCKSAGMDLASIRSKEEQQYLEGFLKEHGFNEGYWLSGTNLGNVRRHNYSWASTGEPFGYTKWLPGQPDNSTSVAKERGESCIQWGMGEGGAEPPGWNDMYCRQKLKYICQEGDSQKC